MFEEFPLSRLTIPRPYPKIVDTGLGAGGNDGKSPPVAPLCPVPPIALEIGLDGGGVGRGDARAEFDPLATAEVGATHGRV